MKNESRRMVRAASLLAVGALFVALGAVPARASTEHAVSSVSTQTNEIVIGSGGNFDAVGQAAPDQILGGSIVDGSGKIESSVNGHCQSNIISVVDPSKNEGGFFMGVTFTWADGSQQVGQLAGVIGGGPDGETLMNGTLFGGDHSSLTFTNMVLTSIGSAR